MGAEPEEISRLGGNGATPGLILSGRLSRTEKRRVALLIRSMNYGGAETQVSLLANGLAELGHQVSLLVFYPGGPMLAQLSPAVKVYCLEKRSRWDVRGFWRRLIGALRDEKPEVLYSFLTVANLLASAAKWRLRGLRVMWGVRSADLDLKSYDWFARFTYWLECRASGWPDLIIVNSEAGRRYALAQGFADRESFVVIPNGIDMDRFQQDAGLRKAVRAEWGVEPCETLVGIVARLDPVKDYPTFLEAAAKVASRGGAARFVSIGAGTSNYLAELKERAARLRLNGKMIWAGPRSDLPGVYSALDVLVSSSRSESFPNVLGEGMACGVPCVATDVGDARRILNGKGVIVRAGDANELAQGIQEMTERTRREGAELREELRRRIGEEFSVHSLILRTSQALESIP